MQSRITALFFFQNATKICMSTPLSQDKDLFRQKDYLDITIDVDTTMQYTISSSITLLLYSIFMYQNLISKKRRRKNQVNNVSNCPIWLTWQSSGNAFFKELTFIALLFFLALTTFYKVKIEKLGSTFKVARLVKFSQDVRGL